MTFNTYCYLYRYFYISLLSSSNTYAAFTYNQMALLYQRSHFQHKESRR